MAAGLPVTVALALGLALILLLHTQGKLFVRADLYILLFALPVLLLAEWVRRLHTERSPDPPAPRRVRPLYALLGMMILFLFASIIRHKWFYFLHWHPQASGKTLLVSSTFWFVLLTLLLMPYFMRKRRHTARWLFVLLLATQVAALGRLLYLSGGDVLARDDHPSFVFRLWQFRETFPQLFTYNPYWNGGVAEYFHYVTGTFAPGLLLWPLWKFAHVPDVYTFGVGLLFIVILPLVVAFSMRAVGGDRLAQWSAGLFALGVSQHFYLWLMQYGTIGANLTAGFVVPVSVLVYRVVVLDRRDAWTAFFLVISAFILLLYPPGAIMALPIVLACLLHARHWTLRKVGALALCGTIVLLLHSRHIVLLLWQDEVLRFFLPSDTSSLVDSSVSRTLDNLRNGGLFLLAHLREAHPVLLFLGVAGAFVAPRRTIRTWYLSILAGFALLTGWGSLAAPDLELSRMAIPMMFAAIVPAALAVSSVLRTSRMKLGFFRAALAAVLILTGINVYRFYDRQGLARYHSIEPEVVQIADWARTELPEGGRLLFAGPTVHAYGGGHVAFLPLISGREMMACDYYHFSPSEVEYNFPPHRFRTDDENIFQFFELYNVVAIATYHDTWIRRFRSDPERYEEVRPLDMESDFSFFRVRRPSSLFHENEGSVRAHFNRIELTLDDPDTDAVIAYNWTEHLRADAPAEIYPQDVGRDVTLIGIRPNGRTHVTIRYTRWL